MFDNMRRKMKQGSETTDPEEEDDDEDDSERFNLEEEKKPLKSSLKVILDVVVPTELREKIGTLDLILLDLVRPKFISNARMPRMCKEWMRIRALKGRLTVIIRGFSPVFSILVCTLSFTTLKKRHRPPGIVASREAAADPPRYGFFLHIVTTCSCP